MSGAMGAANVAVQVCLWLVLLLGLGLIVVRRFPNRIAFAASCGFSTAIAVVLTDFLSGRSIGIADWSAAFVFSAMAFGVALLGTFIGPASRGTTWEKLLEDMTGRHRPEDSSPELANRTKR